MEVEGPYRKVRVRSAFGTTGREQISKTRVPDRGRGRWNDQAEKEDEREQQRGRAPVSGTVRKSPRVSLVCSADVDGKMVWVTTITRRGK